MKKKNKFLSTPQLLSPGRSSIQGQIPYVPIVSTLPPTNDPQSQPYSLVILINGVADGIYSFDARTQPYKWTKVASIPTTAGTVTNFTVTDTAIFAVTNPTTTPNLALKTEVKNTLLAGPASGADAVPTFRALVTPDLPIVLEKNITQVSVNGNVTTDQTLMTFSIPANTLNTVGKVMEVVCYGNYDEDSGPVLTVHVKFGTTAIFTWTPNTPNTTKTNLPWRIYSHFITAATGASGTLEAHGEFSSDDKTTSGAIGSSQLDHNTAVSSALDLTAAQTISVTFAFSSASVANVARQRMMLIRIYN